MEALLLCDIVRTNFQNETNMKALREEGITKSFLQSFVPYTRTDDYPQMMYELVWCEGLGNRQEPSGGYTG